MYKSKKFKIYHKGLSRDRRTNSWSVTCDKCNKSHEPETTMLSIQEITCKCGETEIINYNNLTKNE